MKRAKLDKSEKIIQIQVTQGHESGFLLSALTNRGRILCKMNGPTYDSNDDWMEIVLPEQKSEWGI